MKLWLVIAAAALMAACQPMPMTDAGGGATAGPVRTDAECTARGGTMQRVGRAQTMQCVIAYADAGKPCTDGSQCQGDCRGETTPFPQAGQAARGQCQADSRPFGCHYSVENGRATSAICVD